MGSRIDWSALAGVLEYKEIFGLEVELVIASLEAIKSITDQLKAEATKKS